jgi:hypothetical protein
MVAWDNIPQAILSPILKFTDTTTGKEFDATNFNLQWEFNSNTVYDMPLFQRKAYFKYPSREYQGLRNY